LVAGGEGGGWGEGVVVVVVVVVVLVVVVVAFGGGGGVGGGGRGSGGGGCFGVGVGGVEDVEKGKRGPEKRELRGILSACRERLAAASAESARAIYDEKECPPRGRRQKKKKKRWKVSSADSRDKGEKRRQSRSRCLLDSCFLCLVISVTLVPRHLEKGRG